MLCFNLYRPVSFEPVHLLIRSRILFLGMFAKCGSINAVISLPAFTQTTGYAACVRIEDIEKLRKERSADTSEDVWPDIRLNAVAEAIP